MEHLREQINGITLYEYHCEMCGNFFWMPNLTNTELNCPNCSRKVRLNGVIPINKIEFKKATNKETFVSSLLKQQKKEIFNNILKELQEYKEKYPDADYHDITGYLAGMKMRPNKFNKR